MSAVSAQGYQPQDNANQNTQKLEEQRAHEPSMEEILASIRRIIADDQVLPLSMRPAITPNPRPEVKAAVLPIWSSAPQPGSRPPPPAIPEPVSPPLAAPAPQPVSAHAVPAPFGLDVKTPAEPVFPHAAPAAWRVPAPMPVLVAPQPTPVVAAQSADTDFADTDFADTDSVAAESFDNSFEAHDPAPPESMPEDAPMTHEFEAEPAAAEDGNLVSAETSSSVASSFNTLAATMLVQTLPPVEEIARDMLRPMLKTWLDDNLPILVERLVRVEIERVARGGR